MSHITHTSIQAGGNCHRPTVWPDSSVVRVLAWSARNPGFKSPGLGNLKLEIQNIAHLHVILNIAQMNDHALRKVLQKLNPINKP